MPDTAKIRELNDALRTTFDRSKGTIVITRGVAERCDLPTILERVRAFDQFDEGNDPWREKDFGAICIEGETIYWKIDCYSLDMESGSPDASDETVTSRVLSILLSQEY